MWLGETWHIWLYVLFYCLSICCIINFASFSQSRREAVMVTGHHGRSNDRGFFGGKRGGFGGNRVGFGGNRANFGGNHGVGSEDFNSISLSQGGKGNTHNNNNNSGSTNRGMNGGMCRGFHGACRGCGVGGGADKED